MPWGSCWAFWASCTFDDILQLVQSDRLKLRGHRFRHHGFEMKGSLSPTQETPEKLTPQQESSLDLETVSCDGSDAFMLDDPCPNGDTCEVPDILDDEIMSDDPVRRQDGGCSEQATTDENNSFRLGQTFQAAEGVQDEPGRKHRCESEESLLSLYIWTPLDSVEYGEPVVSAESAVSERSESSTPLASLEVGANIRSCRASKELLHRGDIVTLSGSVPQEYRGSSAVVTQIAEAHCTVAVLDEDRQFGVGECWPGFQDVSIESSTLQLASRVLVAGMTGARTKHLNGLTGVIREHPREGHPIFIRRSEADNPRLTVCVHFDDPLAAKGRSNLLEPRFLTSFEDAAVREAECLRDVAATLLHPNLCEVASLGG